MVAHRCHHKVSFFPLQYFKYKKNVSKKKQNYCLKSSQNARNRAVCLKNFRVGGMPSDPPSMASRLQRLHSRLRR